MYLKGVRASFLSFRGNALGVRPKILIGLIFPERYERQLKRDLCMVCPMALLDIIKLISFGLFSMLSFNISSKVKFALWWETPIIQAREG